MSEHPNSEHILEVATELGVHPSFVEKDWYAIQALGIIASAKVGDFVPIFSGGTSLSKGYGLIQRFSEDIDFKVSATTGKTRNELRDYRAAVIQQVRRHSSFDIKNESIVSQDGSKFFSFDIVYPQAFELDSSLRPHLKFEMRYQVGEVLSETRHVRSFLEEFTQSAEAVTIDCVAPVETAADKFCALIWRVINRDRSQALGTAKNDPTMIRHLHDLCALEPLVISDARLQKLISSVFETDKLRGGGVASEFSLAEAFSRAKGRLEEEHADYQGEYTRFVQAMSYAPDADQITFSQALTSIEHLAAAVLE